MTDSSYGALWSEYVDWCSARVAARFLELSSDQIWELADRQRTRPLAAQPPTVQPSPHRDAAYVELVRQVTLDLFTEMGLPDFQTWRDQQGRVGGRTSGEDATAPEAGVHPGAGSPPARG